MKCIYSLDHLTPLLNVKHQKQLRTHPKHHHLRMVYLQVDPPTRRSPHRPPTFLPLPRANRGYANAQTRCPGGYRRERAMRKEQVLVVDQRNKLRTWYPYPSQRKAPNGLACVVIAIACHRGSPTQAQEVTSKTEEDVEDVFKDQWACVVKK